MLSRNALVLIPLDLRMMPPSRARSHALIENHGPDSGLQWAALVCRVSREGGRPWELVRGWRGIREAGYGQARRPLDRGRDDYASPNGIPLIALRATWAFAWQRAAVSAVWTR